jgi:hypothetical protein
MKRTFLFFCLLLLVVNGSRASVGPSAKPLMPDTIIMNDGTEIHGLIIKNDAEEVILQDGMGDMKVPKRYIRRIEDQGNEGVYFAELVRPETIPPWRMMVQDLRNDDNIHSFRQIPATTIDNGYLRNIPYLSFRINKHTEMNVYGNPEDPVCLEFGVYEHGDQITMFKKIIRAYLAGFLNSRSEIGALYSLSEKGDERQAGKLRFKVLPPSAPDAYGGWWISVYEPNRIDQARVSDAEYRKVTLPFLEVNTLKGNLREEKAMHHDKFLGDPTIALAGTTPDLLGFYRTKTGELNLVTAPAQAAPSPPPK